jgi:hypothetical protein
MEFSQVVKDEKNRVDQSAWLREKSITKSEVDIGYGRHMFPIVYTLTFANSLLILQKWNKGNSPRYFLGAVLLSYPVTFLVSKYLFGVNKFREIASRDRDTAMSARVYETDKSYADFVNNFSDELRDLVKKDKGLA